MTTLEFSLHHLVGMDSNTFLLVVCRYNNTTGTFTVPPGGDGFYLFSVYLWVRNDKNAAFDIRINGELLCTAIAEASEYQMASCIAATYAVEGIQETYKNSSILIFKI